MSKLQVFPTKEFGNIRTMIIDGKEYFCGNDVASALCYQVPKNAIARHCKGALMQCPVGESQEMKYIPVGDVYRLIVKASSQSNSEEIKEKAERFERLVFDEILPKIHETGSYGIPKDTDGKIALLAQGHSELRADINNVRTEVENLKNSLPVFITDAKDIQNAIRKKAIEVLGGTDSVAYHDRSIRGYTFADIQIEVRRQFGVKRYDQIKHKDVPTALKIVEDYKPPFHIREKIEATNAQLSFDLEGGASV